MKNKIMVNFELMRIISMLMIVLWHIIIHGGFDNVVDNYGRLFDIILAIIIVHVNSFVILMGFFQYKKKFKFNKILNLLGVSWFYRIFFVLIFAFCFHYIYAADILTLNIMPIDMNDNYWFIMKYVLLYALCPFLNALINNIGKKQHFVLLILLFICFSVLPLFSGDSIILNDGHSLIQMITLYFIGAYLGKYSIFDHCFIKKMSSKKRTVISIFIFILCAFLNLALYKLGIIMQRFDGSFLHIIGDNFVSYRLNYSNPIIIIQTVAYFYIFWNLKIKNNLLSKIVLMISPYCLGVYLITENKLVKQFVYEFLHLNTNYFNYTLEYVLYMLLMMFLIFIICIVIERIRAFIFKILGKMKMLKKIKMYINYYTDKINEVVS